MKTTTTLVSYLGNVYTWETIFTARGKRMAEICPRGGGTVIACRVRDLRVLPSPGLKTTYSYAGSC
jgi:hypothetical protein